MVLRLLTILSIGFITACSNQQIKLNTYDQPYTQFKHIIDKRYDGSVNSSGKSYTEGDLVLKHLDNLSRAAIAGAYLAGTVQMDKDMLLVQDSEFSIPPALALNMALENLATEKNKELAPFELTAFAIRTQYLFMGIPNSSNNASCNIYANYRGAKLWSTQTTTYGFSDYNIKMTNMINDCIKGIINRINYHDDNAENLSDSKT